MRSPEGCSGFSRGGFGGRGLGGWAIDGGGPCLHRLLAVFGPVTGQTAEEAEVVGDSAGALLGSELAVLSEFTIKRIRSRRGRGRSVVGLLLLLLRPVLLLIVVARRQRRLVVIAGSGPRGLLLLFFLVQVFLLLVVSLPVPLVPLHHHKFYCLESVV